MDYRQNARFFCSLSHDNLELEGFSITNLLNRQYKIWRIAFPIRLTFPVLVIIFAKVAASLFVYNTLNIGTSGTFWSNPTLVYNWTQNAVFLNAHSAANDWTLTFLGWDSAWYLSILSHGYSFSTQSYTFSPALPFFSGLGNFLLQNPFVSITLTSLVFGVLWIPIFQLLAEEFIDRKAALIATLLLAFSPYLFVFTTVAYSEGLLLSSVLGAWLLFRKQRFLAGSIFAFLAPLARTMGLIVVLPLLYESLKSNKNRVRNIILSLIPVFSLAGWFTYLGFITKDFLAPVHTSEWSGLYSLRTLLTEGIPQYGIQALLEAPKQTPPIITNWLLPISATLALIIPPLLFYSLWKTNRSLFAYSLVGYLGILYFGALVSTPRFISVLFPLCIPIAAKFVSNKKITIIAFSALAISYITAVYLWISFLNGQFIA